MNWLVSRGCLNYLEKVSTSKRSISPGTVDQPYFVKMNYEFQVILVDFLLTLLTDQLT